MNTCLEELLDVDLAEELQLDELPKLNESWAAHHTSLSEPSRLLVLVVLTGPLCWPPGAGTPWTVCVTSTGTNKTLDLSVKCSSNLYSNSEGTTVIVMPLIASPPKRASSR